MMARNLDLTTLRSFVAVADTGGSAEQAIREANKMIDSEGAVALLGPASGEMVALVDLAKRKKTVIMSPYAGTITLNKLGGDYDTTSGIFQPSLSFPVSDNGRLSLRYTAKLTDVSSSGAIEGGVIDVESEEGQRIDSSLGYTYSWDTRRAGLDPKNTYLFEFSQDFFSDG